MGAILEVRNIYKYYGSLAANHDVSLTVEKGSIHAIIGENGAGKSTLMNILSGVVEPSSGEILLEGEPQAFKSAMDAARVGVGMVQQEFMLYPGLTVLENIILGDEETKLGLFLDMAACERKILAICWEYGFAFDLHVDAASLPVVQQQQVEIVKVLYRNAQIIILDEPTAVLPPQEIEGLFKAIRFLIQQGKTILFITHKLKEVLAVSDSITVMKTGRVVGTLPVAEATERLLTNMMVGRDVLLEVQKAPQYEGRDVTLAVENLTVRGNNGLPKVKNLSFGLRKGEIVGVVGVAGNGQSELVQAITGERDYEGSVRIQGASAHKLSPRADRLAGMGYVPQDRGGVGSAAASSLLENTLMGGHLKRFKKHRFLMDYKAGAQYAAFVVEKFKVKAQSLEDRASSLSGGNLQKLIVGREFSQDNQVLVIEDPIRGIDVGAIEFIWNEIIRQVEEEGVSVLLVTYDLNEAMTLSDRLLVMYDGEVRKELAGPHYDENEIGLYMLGGEGA